MSAGLGTVPPGQTYLDVTQGNRVFDSLYDEALPPLRRREGCCANWFEAANDRAASAPAEIEPNLLGVELHLGVTVARAAPSACAFGGSAGTIGDPLPRFFLSSGAPLAEARSGEGGGKAW